MIGRSIAAALAGAALAIGPPASVAAEQAAPATSSGPVYEAALGRLLDQIAGEQQVVAAASANFDANFDGAVAGQPGGAAIDPGLKDAIRAAGRAEMARVLHDGYPGLRAAAAAKVRGQMTLAELEQANTFYASPTGRKMIAAAAASARGKDMAAIQQSSAQGAVAALSPEDGPVLMAFAATPAFAKIRQLGPELQRSSVEWASGLVAANLPRLSQASQTAAESYLAAHPGVKPPAALTAGAKP